MRVEYKFPLAFDLIQLHFELKQKIEIFRKWCLFGTRLDIFDGIQNKLIVQNSKISNRYLIDRCWHFMIQWKSALVVIYRLESPFRNKWSCILSNTNRSYRSDLWRNEIPRSICSRKRSPLGLRIQSFLLIDNVIFLRYLFWKIRSLYSLNISTSFMALTSSHIDIDLTYFLKGALCGSNIWKLLLSELSSALTL